MFVYLIDFQLSLEIGIQGCVKFSPIICDDNMLDKLLQLSLNDFQLSLENIERASCEKQAEMSVSFAKYSSKNLGSFLENMDSSHHHNS